MSTRNEKQLRCMRHYARVLGVSDDVGGMLWVTNGLAERWAEQN
jgi:hypothetical protein